MDRRKFLKNVSLASFSAGSLFPSIYFTEREEYTPLRIGLCADLHQDFIPDAPRRLSAFIDEMKKKKPDFIVQLGDFCQPSPENKEIMDIWDRFSGPKYHVMGNHDPEGDFTQDDVVNFWNAKGKYYSFNLKGYHFVVLNGNEQNPEHDTLWKYERYISDTQLDWLRNDLKTTDLPVILFCHQGLDNDEYGIENAMRVRLVLERANKAAGFRKVQLVFSGHHHQDYHNVINGIHYIQINSMSYHWQGNKYAESPFGKKLNEEYPLLKYMAHYRDPIWAIVDISSDGMLHLHGRKSSFIGKSPADLGMPPYEYTYPVVPYISDKKFQLTSNLFSTC